MIKKLLSSNSQNYFCTLIIGKKYNDNFYKYSYPLFKKYCKKYDIGIFIITSHLISKKNIYWKNPNWQKLIAPKILENKYKKIKNLCMVDSDILINSEAPNIFNSHKKNHISVVSLRKHMPYTWENSTRLVAFLRNRFYSKKYPLDSAINISLNDLYKFHNLEPQKDEFCAGVYIISKNSFNKLNDFFYKYKTDIKTITGGGEQTHFNYFVQKNFRINTLDYKFQAQWVFEMANYYPFLYTKAYRNDKKLISTCLENSLRNNYFLHFAGSWNESLMWKIKSNTILGKDFLKKFIKYKKIKLKGKPVGIIKR